jgi:hypothetical protein
VADPGSAGEHDGDQDDDHDQIDAQHSEQRNDHAVILALHVGVRLTPEG